SGQATPVPVPAVRPARDGVSEPDFRESPATDLLKEGVMYDPPAYVWALIIAGPAAIGAATCAALYGGAARAGLGRGRAALLAGAAAVLLGGWFTASALIARNGSYNTRPGQMPWLAIAVAGALGTLLALSRIPVVARALRAPGMTRSLVLPHSF